MAPGHRRFSGNPIDSILLPPLVDSEEKPHTAEAASVTAALPYDEMLSRPGSAIVPGAAASNFAGRSSLDSKSQMTHASSAGFQFSSSSQSNRSVSSPRGASLMKAVKKISTVQKAWRTPGETEDETWFDAVWDDDQEFQQQVIQHVHRQSMDQSGRQSGFASFSGSQPLSGFCKAASLQSIGEQQGIAKTSRSSATLMVPSTGSLNLFESAVAQLVSVHEGEMQTLRSQVGSLKDQLKKMQNDRAASSSVAHNPRHLPPGPMKLEQMAPRLPPRAELEQAADSKVSPFEDLPNACVTEEADKIAVGSPTSAGMCGATGSAISVPQVWGSSENSEDDKDGAATATSNSSEAHCDYSDKQIQAWKRIVYKAVSVAQQQLSHLHETWIENDAFIRQVRYENPHVDLWAAAARENQDREKTARLARTTLNSSKSGVLVNLGYFGSAGRISRFGNRISQVSRGRISNFQAHSLVIDPNSGLRMAWATAGMCFMVYDLITLPMQAFEFEESDFGTGMSWLGQIFWTLDILFSFFTGVFINSELVRSLRTIAWVYMKGWFMFDLIVVVPLWIVLILGADSDYVNNIKAFRYLRMLRFLRLLRLAKFERMLSDALASINSPVLLLVLGMVKLMVCLILLSHINACIWFSVGKVDQGWTMQVDGKSKFFKYLASMHWALTQFQGTSEIVPGETTGERLYAVCTVLFSLLILSTFVSSLTNMMMELQHLSEDRKFQDREVRSFLVDHRISSSLSVRVRKYVEWKQKLQKKQHDEVKIAGILPEQLLMDLQDEIRTPLFVHHPFFSLFRDIYPRLSRRLSHTALQVLSPAPGELMFAAQETCFRMYFILEGEGVYTIIRRHVDGQAETVGEANLRKGQHVSEPALWMQWQHRGNFVISKFASIVVLTADSFEALIKTHPPALCSCTLYARRYMNGMIRFAYSRLTDVINPSQMIPADVEEEVQLTNLMS